MGYSKRQFVAAPDYARIVTDQGDEYEFYGEKDGRPVRVRFLDG